MLHDLGVLEWLASHIPLKRHVTGGLSIYNRVHKQVYVYQESWIISPGRGLNPALGLTVQQAYHKTILRPLESNSELLLVSFAPLNSDSIVTSRSGDNFQS